MESCECVRACACLGGLGLGRGWAVWPIARMLLVFLACTIFVVAVVVVGYQHYQRRHRRDVELQIRDDPLHNLSQRRRHRAGHGHGPPSYNRDGLSTVVFGPPST